MTDNSELRARLTEAARKEWEAMPESSKQIYRLANDIAKAEADFIRHYVDVQSYRFARAEEDRETLIKKIAEEL